MVERSITQNKTILGSMGGEVSKYQGGDTVRGDVKLSRGR